MSISMFRIGEQHPVQLLILEPLFEEANRTRRTLAQVMRALDRRGVGSAIPDLPGTGESLTDIASVRLKDWRAAVAESFTILAEGGKNCVIASFRGGAILDDAAPTAAIWRCAPESGARILRDLKRAAKASEAADDGKLAGHGMSDAFLSELELAAPASLPNIHVARLETDAAEADTRLAGSPIWRRAEPGEDSALIASIGDHLALWVTSCATA